MISSLFVLTAIKGSSYFWIWPQSFLSELGKDYHLVEFLKTFTFIILDILKSYRRLFRIFKPKSCGCQEAWPATGLTQPELLQLGTILLPQ